MDELYCVTRGIVNTEMNQSYIQMAQFFNVSTLNILFKHLLPKVLPSIFVIMIVDFGKSFYTLVHYHFRFRCTTTISRVGAMLQAGREFITSHPIMIIAPASLISGTILIFNFNW